MPWCASHRLSSPVMLSMILLHLAGHASARPSSGCQLQRSTHAVRLQGVTRLRSLLAPRAAVAGTSDGRHARLRLGQARSADTEHRPPLTLLACLSGAAQVGAAAQRRVRAHSALRKFDKRAPRHAHVPSVSEWCAAVAQLRAAPNPAHVFKYAADLKRVDGPAVAAALRDVQAAVSQLLGRTSCKRLRKASMLDALASSLQAHPPLLGAASADAELCAQLDGALELAAADDETYRDAMCTAQMSTAQGKLGRYCAPFWHRLEHHGVRHLGARQLATVLHRAATMPGSDVDAQSPTEGLVAALVHALPLTMPAMDPQQVANCVYACGQLECTPDPELAGAMTTAVVARVQRMRPQGLVNTMWGLHELQLPTEGQLQDALVAALHRQLPHMNAVDTASAALSLAKLQLRPDERLQEALCSALLRTSGEMGGQGVATTLMAFSKLGWRPHGRLRNELLRGTLRESAKMLAQDVANTFCALAELELRPDEATRAALCSALEREAAVMVPAGVHTTRRALQRLRWPVSDAAQRQLGMA